MAVVKKFLSDEDFIKHINECIDAYKGDTTLLNEATGLMVVGRVMGWEHQRIVSTRVSWTFATKVFGDPKKFMPKRTVVGQRKSVALAIVDKFLSIGKIMRGYLDLVQRKISVPVSELRLFND